MSARELSIVVPVRNGAATLAVCLDALRASAAAGAEVIVVDDASGDGSADVAARAGATVLRLDRWIGAARARNRGARAAARPVLLFLDADVRVREDTIARVDRILAERPDVAAVFGSYDAEPTAPGVVSQFRNLLHHFVHHENAGEARTFWTGCGAVRRAAFDAVGGFDEGRFASAMEDVELGYRLHAAGHRILLDPAVQVTHLKRWTLRSFLWTDLARRAIPWSRLMLARGEPPDHLNLRAPQRASVVLAGVLTLLVVVGLVRPVALVAALAVLVGFVALNHRLLAFFARARGPAFAVAAVPLLLLHHLVGGIGYAWAWAEHRLGTVRSATRTVG
jgi:GT2 family glycosyltransferase